MARKHKMNNLKNENGYVLVVIIGILTILSLMAITFATLSRIETRATRNYTDSVKCEKIAKAGLEYAIYIMRQDKFGDDGEAYNDDNGDENYDEAGGTSWPGDGIFDGNDYDNDGDTTNDSAWIYFPIEATSSSDIRLPGKLRARYAVLITDDREARINVNVTGNQPGGGAHTSNEGWSTFEIDMSNIINLASTGKGTATANSIIDARLGSDDAPGTSTPTNDDNGIVPDPESDGIDNDGDWDSSTHDTDGNGIPDSGETNLDESDEATDEPNEFNSIFPYGDDIPFGILSEAEIMGTTSYESRLEEIFTSNSVTADSLNSWVTTCSADTILCPSYQLDGGTSTTMLNINALVNNEGAYTGGYYDSDKKVEMIIDVLTAGGVPDVERQQIAVNIIDFIDSDDTVTKYPESLIPTPVYYGVERTPYINEVEAMTSSGLDEFIELFNPYNTAIPNTGDWTITLDGDTTTITLTGLTIPAGGYYVIADQAGAGVDLVDAAGINNLDDAGEELILRDSSGNIVQVTNYGSANNQRSMQLNDPRPNPLADVWGVSSIDSSNPWRWYNVQPSSVGAENDMFDPSPWNPNAVDGWENTTPTWPDSFLIANRRFSNKGYLGFIHRGRQWSSFRVNEDIDYPDTLQYFTVTDPSMDSIDNDGDDDIDSVDTGTQTADFDGPEYRIPGLINVNTASVEVLDSLPGITNAIAIAIQGDNDKPFSSIGNLLEDVPDITNTGSTKWDKEKPFRSISNLITTRSNVFTVYVTAQVIDDTISTVYAEKRILAIVDRSVDPIKVRYFRWLVE